MIDDEDVLKYLEHFGIKGQRWGVRKKQETSDNKSSFQKDLAKNPPKPLTKQQKANVARASKKFEAQRDLDPEPEPKGWRPTKKQAITIGIGAAAAAAIVGGLVINKQYQDVGSKPFSVDQYKKHVNTNEPPGWISGYAGQHMSVDDFKGITQTSVGRIWGEKQYITDKSFDQKETVFPKGHKFFRVSHRPETEFRDTTFMVASKADAARYQLGWKAGFSHLIDFDATDDVRVPDLHTRLEATREAMRAEGRKHVTPQQVMDRYSASAGSPMESRTTRSMLDILRGKGYHAIVDDMDAGVYGEMPLVLIDKSRVSDKHTTLEQDVNREELESILTDIPNRR